MNQRELSERSGISLGMVNRALKALEETGFLNRDYTLTEQSLNLLKNYSPKRAVILAAGYGMRMVPINMETPKGMIQVEGEPLIERLIRQLHTVGIRDILVIVGFMKEQFEYLIDDFGVQLRVNAEYASSNNLHSLTLAKDWLQNSYILPCDIYCRENPFHKEELYSWYMVADQPGKSRVRVNRKLELVETEKEEPGNPMIGISYITGEIGKILQERLLELSENPAHRQAFWEEALFPGESSRMYVSARCVSSGQYIEINTYEQLRELDSKSDQLRNQAVTIAAQALHAKASEIRDILVMKKGMTNRSFLFTCKNQKYIMRIPDEGSDRLMDRRGEARVYKAIHGEHVGDDVLYFNPDNGYKIARYIENARPCDPSSEEDLKLCISFLREFHQKKLKTGRNFNILEKAKFYESLWKSQQSAYRDYEKTREQVFSLKNYIEKYKREKYLTHLDAVPDNFLIFTNADGIRQVRLIDWEYASMQDPYVDIAMFVISAMFDKKKVDHIIDLYFDGKCRSVDRTMIYCYISACGFMWSNWCEYQRNLGTEFGEYSLRQYRYAKEYYRYAAADMKRE